MDDLQDFIVDAKQATYVGGGRKAAPCRTGSHDLIFRRGPWSYMDSYFGGTDFLGQEVVWRDEQPVWAMNYYGHILSPDAIDAGQAGEVIKTALSGLYRDGRFLGGFKMQVDGYDYEDRSEGGVERFRGIETISRSGSVVYELQYHGGLVKA